MTPSCSEGSYDVARNMPNGVLQRNSQQGVPRIVRTQGGQEVICDSCNTANGRDMEVCKAPQWCCEKAQVFRQNGERLREEIDGDGSQGFPRAQALLRPQKPL
jgi:hypothetical protein